MIKRVTTFLPLCILISISYAQLPEIVWQRTFGGIDDDRIHSVKQCQDNGFILAGFSFSPLSGNKTEDSIGAADYWVIKTDHMGNMEWQNNIGGTEGDHLYDILQSMDGGYILAGYSYSEIGGDKTEGDIGNVDRTKKDYWIIKLNSSGEILWQNTIGGDLEDNLWSIDETNDGGFILGGYSASYVSEDKIQPNFGPDSTTDYWVVKVSNIGDIQWQTTLGGNKNDELYSIKETFDGGYILGGGSSSDISGSKTEESRGEEDYWIIKLNIEGEEEWQKTIGGSGEEELEDIIQTSDGGFLLGGYSDSEISGDKTENCFGKDDFWVVKLNEVGEIEWQKNYGGVNDDLLHSVLQKNNGNFIIAGNSRSGATGNKTENSFGSEDYWVMETTPTGAIIWQKTLGGMASDKLNSICETIDGALLLGGYSKSDPSGIKTEICFGNYDFWIVKLTMPELIAIDQLEQQNLNIVPNPAFNYLTFDFTNTWASNITCRIANSAGQTVLNTTFPINENTIGISELKSGIYFISLFSDNTNYYGKFVKN